MRHDHNHRLDGQIGHVHGFIGILSTVGIPVGFPSPSHVWNCGESSSPFSLDGLDVYQAGFLNARGKVINKLLSGEGRFSMSIKDYRLPKQSSKGGNFERSIRRRLSRTKIAIRSRPF